MAFTYRTAGAWGAGKGANLTPVEVDQNFYQAEQRIAAVESDPSTPVGIAEIVVTGNSMTIILTDAQEFGPFELPIATIVWGGEWEPGEAYASATLFSVSTGPDAGLYLVVLDGYEAGTEFDPDAFTTAGLYLTKLYAIPTVGQMPLFETATDYTALASHAGYYIRVNSASARDVTIETDLVGGYLDGSVYTFRQAGAGELTLVPAVGVTINTPETLTTRRQHSTVTIIKVGEDEWDLTGDMDPEAVTATA
jgi:hypothetical protein